MKKTLSILLLLSTISLLQAAETPPSKKRRIKKEPVEAAGQAGPAAEPVTSFILTFTDGKTITAGPTLFPLFSRLSPFDDSDPEYYQNLPHKVDFTSSTFVNLLKHCKYGPSVKSFSLKTFSDADLSKIVYAANELELANRNGELVTLLAEVYRRKTDPELIEQIEKAYPERVVTATKKTARELKRLS